MSSRCNGPRAGATRSSCSGTASTALRRAPGQRSLMDAAQARELRPRLLETDSRSQASNGAQRIVLGSVSRASAYGTQTSTAPTIGSSNPSGATADDFVRFTAQLNRRSRRPTDRRRSCRTPQPVLSTTRRHRLADLRRGARTPGRAVDRIGACGSSRSSPAARVAAGRRPSLTRSRRGLAVVGERGDRFEGGRLLAKRTKSARP